MSLRSSTLFAFATNVAIAPLLLTLLALPAFAYESQEYGFRIDPKGAEVSEAPASDTDRFGIVITGKAGWQIRVRIAPVEPTATSETLLQRSLEHIDGDPIYSSAKHEEGTLAGLPSHALSVSYDYNGTPYRIVARFAVANNLRYIVQASAGTDHYAKHKDAIREVVETFEILKVDADKRATYKLDGLARRCGSEVNWAPRWAVAAQRARAEQKLVFVVARYYPGFDISDSLAAGALFDEDVVALINERYVPLRLRKDDPVPFRSYEKYGLGPSTFGQAILLVDYAGIVVTETFTADPWTVDTFLRNAARSTRLSLSEVGAPDLETARSLYARGELFEALQHVRDAESAESVEGLRLLSAIHRRQRNGHSSLAALKAASQILAAKKHPSPEQAKSVAGELTVDQAIIHMRLGDSQNATALLEQFLREQRNHDRAPEAMYTLASLHFAAGKSVSGDSLLHDIVGDHPSSRWAWKAAATLKNSAKSLGLKPHLAWPDEALLEELQPWTRKEKPIRFFNVRGATHAARRFLVEQQRPDGSWIYPPDVLRAPDSPPSAIGAAITAMAGYSLLPKPWYGDVPVVLERTLASIEATRNEVDKKGELLHYMDYWVWAKTYQLFFVARALEVGFGDRSALETLGDELISELSARQRRSGGWSYYLKRDLAAAENDQQSISFVTAPVLLALLDARQAGLTVHPDVVNRALDCLSAMKNDNGTFDYMGGIGIDNGSTGLGGAAGRGPLCALALVRGGRGRVDEIRGALDIFKEHWKGLAREQGKNLMHAGPEAQGSHYILFDAAYAAAALRKLPKEEHSDYLEPIERLLKGAQYGDSFIDNPEMGRPSCTALALMALQALPERKRRRF